MFLLRFIATPMPGSLDAATAGGAYVNCWVDVLPQEAARTAAHGLIAEAGWKAESLLEEAEVTRDDLDEEAIARFDQACIDKAIVEFFVWPLNASDDTEQTRNSNELRNPS